MSNTFTGERFIPGIEDIKLSVEHFQRYLSIRKLVEGKSVLDAACGEGYGSNLLAELASTVVGIDIDASTIENAKEKYVRENLKYMNSSIENLPFPDKSMDVVVSFETIEHVPETVQNSFIKEISRVLKDDGILIMSTPNKEIYSDRYNYKNEFHIKEFYYDEFYDFLKREFSCIKVYNQGFEIVSLITPCSVNEPVISYIGNADNYETDGKYYIAVASKNTVDDFEIASAYISDRGEYQDNIQRILTLQQEEEARNSHIRKLDEETKRLGDIIRELQDKNVQIETANRLLVEERDLLRTDNDSLRTDNVSLKTNNSFLKADCKLLEEENINLKTEKVELEQIVRNKDGHIGLLLEVERSYEREKKTHAYKFAKKLQKMGDFLLPVSSRRRFFARVLVNLLRKPKLMLKVINPKRIHHYFKYMRLEGIEGVKRRYDEAVELEKIYVEPVDYLDVIEVETVKQSKSIEKNKKKIEDYEIISFVECQAPKVSIIIPVYNEFDYTYQCLKSIKKNSKAVDYEVIIADDCSTDITKDIKMIVNNIAVVRTDDNLRFLRNCNNAAKHAKGKYILFLNNDTQVQEDWLRPLVELLETDNTIGMVGSKLVYPDGYLQEAGGILWNDGSAWNYGNRQNPNDSEFNYVREVDYISGASIMIRASLWEEIGGFDDRFAPAYCEDSDIAFEIRKRGYKVVYQPKSVVVHFEGISNGTDTSSGQKQYQVLNQQKFMEKWGEELQQNHFANGTNVLVARDRSKNIPHVLVIDHYVPQYDKDAGSKTTYMYLKMLLKKGYHVTFLGDNFYQHEPYTTELQQMGICVLYGLKYAENWKDWMIENLQYYDVIYLNRPHITVKYIDFIKENINTRTKVIYYGHDLHFLRIKREYELTKNEDTLNESNKWREQELNIMRKADVTYYPSQVEIDAIREIDNSIKVKAITAYVYEDFPSIEYNPDEREGLLFVGGFGHDPNLDAVLWFLENIFPKVYERIKVPFYIVGSKAPKAITECKVPGVVSKGFVTEEELATLYKKCRVVVVPLRYGAGVKGKVVEALYNGVPIVTTDVGAEGINGVENVVRVVNSAEEMIDSICNLYLDKSSLCKMATSSYEFVKQQFGLEAAWKIIKEDFTCNYGRSI